MTQQVAMQNAAKAVALGKALLDSGAEISRVEDTIRRLIDLYGLEHSCVFCITSLITVSAYSDEYNVFISIRCEESSINLYRLEALNALSRTLSTLCDKHGDLEEIIVAVKEKTVPGKYLPFAGYCIAAGAFAALFGGKTADVVSSSIIAALVYFAGFYLRRNMFNTLVYTATSSFVIGMLASVFCAIGFGTDCNAVIIGNAMLLVPGITAANALRDMLWGDMIAGTLRLTMALLLTLSIAAGLGMALYI